MSLLIKSLKHPVHLLPEVCKSKSHTYLKIWKDRHIDFHSKMPPEMERHPEVVHNILKIEAFLQERGLVSFVHASPAGSKVLSELYNALYGAHQFFSYLRPKDKRYMVTYQRAIKGIPQTKIEESKPHLLSVSYALTSSITPLESAASWGFRNHFGCEQNFALLRELDMILDEENLPAEAKMHLKEKGWQLIRFYGRQKVGNFHIIGVPNHKVSRYFYDSRPYNVPTGKEVLAVAEDPAGHLETLMSEGHQATMVICDETLDPKSGLVTVTANTHEEVDPQLAAFVNEFAEIRKNPQKNRHFERIEEDLLSLSVDVPQQLP